MQRQATGNPIDGPTDEGVLPVAVATEDWEIGECPSAETQKTVRLETEIAQR
jgi:hypothetical protein